MKSDPEQDQHHFPYHLILTFASLVIIVTGLKLGAGLFIPVLLSLFIAILCSRPIKWLHGRGVSVNLSILCVLFVVTLASALLIWLVMARLGDLVDQLPALEESLSEHYAGLLRWFDALGLPFDAKALQATLDPGMLMDSLPSLLGGIGNFITQLGIIGILIIFILYETLDFPYKCRVPCD